MKSGVRVIGIDDSPFQRNDKTALVVGVVCRKGRGTASDQSLIVEGVLSTRVHVDGDDGTEKLCGMILNSRFKAELNAILLNGIMLAGFNVVEINELSSETGIPVLALTRKKPDPVAVENALKKVPGWEVKLSKINSAGSSKRIEGWHAQLSGTDLNGARDIIRIFGNSPVRLAHLIASGVIRGESRGRA